MQAEPVKGRTRLVIPLLLKGEPSGFVDLSGRLDRPFSDDEIEVAQILANQTAVAVENARLYEKIERQAITDGLTGLYNHREFHERLRAEVARSWRYNTPVSLLMVDIDDFKQFNDTYGHVVGDDVLRAVGRLLTGGLRRDVDVAARYGGEEFAVILPNTPADAAHAVGERMRATLSGGGRGVASGAADWPVTWGGGSSAFDDAIAGIQLIAVSERRVERVRLSARAAAKSPIPSTARRKPCTNAASAASASLREAPPPVSRPSKYGASVAR